MAGIPAGVVFSPDTIVQRQSAGWRGIAAENVQVTRQEPFEYRLRAPCHLLIASHRAERRDGRPLSKDCRDRPAANSTAG